MTYHSDPASASDSPFQELYYVESVGHAYTSLETKKLIGFEPSALDDPEALNAKGIYLVNKAQPDFDERLYEVGDPIYTINGSYADQTWTQTAKPLDEAKAAGKEAMKVRANELAGTGDGFNALMLIAAASKTAANRSTEAQDALDDLVTVLDELVADIQAIEAATDVDEVNDIVNQPIVFTVTVSGGAFLIDGVEKASLSLNSVRTYRFDQSDASNSGHPLKIYPDANKTFEITDGVSFVGTPGSAGAYTEFSPIYTGEYSYQCSAHDAMGGSIVVF